MVLEVCIGTLTPYKCKPKPFWFGVLGLGLNVSHIQFGEFAVAS